MVRRFWQYKWVRWGGVLLLAGVLAVVLNYHYVTHRTSKALFDDVSTLEKRKVGLLLGTAKYLSSGRINLYYRYRIRAAVALFEAKKVDYLLVSGDNSVKTYNEPATIQADLIAAGVPADRIYLDYAGFRTLDSVVRARRVFGQQKVTIISQPFHNARAVYLAQRKGLDAIAFNAQDVAERYGWKVIVREYLARVKMQLDIIFGKSPKFLGEAISIP